VESYVNAKFVIAALALAIPSIAHAGQCEDTFVKKGAVIGGLKFTATRSVADLSPKSAIGQMRGIALADGMSVLSVEADDGSMLLEQAQTNKARSFPIIVTATQEAKLGTVTLQANLRGGMMTKEEDAKVALCGLLNKLQGGKAGLALAAKGLGAVGAVAAPVKITALGLSQQLSKERDRNAEAIPLRYKGKSYTIEGPVDYVKKDGDAYRVAFRIPEPHEQVLRLPGQSNTKTDISCLMAKGQAAYALTLKPNKMVKLTGTYDSYRETPPIMWLSNCRPE
jgi:hypothetical protein